MTGGEAPLENCPRCNPMPKHDGKLLVGMLSTGPDRTSSARRRFRRFLLCVLEVCAVAFLAAISWQIQGQEFDTVVSSQNRKAYTIADQVESELERRALTGLFAPNLAPEKARLAEIFLASFPTSWLLPQALEIASKAFIELGDYSQALRYGRESLDLLPENPLLLVPLANVYIQQSQLADARVSAKLALRYLDEFAPPLSVGAAEWPGISRQLKASAYFALGRAEITEGLSLAPGKPRTQLLKESLRLLTTARQLNPADGEIAYLLGLGLLTDGQAQEAALNFATAQTLNTTLQGKAVEQLRRIHQSRSIGGAEDFQRFLEELSARARKHQDQLKASTSEAANDEDARGAPNYAGSESCRSCHSEQHHSWQQTGMARMFRAYDPANVIGDFGSGEPFYAEDRVNVERSSVGCRRRRQSLSVCADVEGERKAFLRNQDLRGCVGSLSRGLHNRIQVAAGLRYAAAQRADSRLSHPVQCPPQAMAELLEDYRSGGFCPRRCQDL